MPYIWVLAMMLIAIVSCKPSLTDNITSSASTENVTSTSPMPDALIVAADVVIQADMVKLPILSQFEINPSFVWLNPHEEVTLTATALDQFNQPFEDFEISWELDQDIDGIVDQDGRFIAGPDGGYFSGAIIAVATQIVDGRVVELESRAAVLVEQQGEISELARIQVVPKDIVVFQGQLLSLMAFGIGETGGIIPDVLFNWEVMDDSWGKLVAEDMVKVFAAPGEYESVLAVTGRYGEKEITSSVSVKVLDPLISPDAINVQIIPTIAYITVGEEYHFEAIAIDANGEHLKDVSVSWSAGQDTGGNIADGAFKAGNVPGVYTDAISVMVLRADDPDGLVAYGYATIVVEPVVNQVLTNISLLPSSSVVAVGKPIQYRIYAFDEDGGLIPGVSVDWDVNDSVGAVNEYGRFVASGPAGYYPDAIQTTVSHRGVDLVATADITITGSLKKAVIWPAEVEVAPGDVVLFKASGVDENNVEISSLVVDFRLSDPTVGSITPFGYFIAGDTNGHYKAIVEARVVQLP